MARRENGSREHSGGRPLPGVGRDERYLRTVLNALPDVFYAVDPAAGELVGWNERLESVTGYDAGTLAGMPPAELVSAADEGAIEAAIDGVVASDERRPLEVTLVTADGEERPYEFVGERVPGPDGEDLVVGTGRDLSERARQREELRRRNDRLEEFASIVSHDLRSPLTVANGYVRMAREDHDDERIEKAVDALDRMDSLIEGLLRLASDGRTVGDLDPVALGRVATAAWEGVATPDASLELAGDLPVVEADADRLVRLFENLFRNAVEHGSTSPASQAQQDPVEHAGAGVTVSVARLDDARGFYVADDGPGIPEGAREQVFESGYSTGARASGHGLDIVHELATAHGWESAVTGSEAGGARFEFVVE